jgi:transposase
LEKRGLTAQLAEQQVSGTSVIVWGDEMRYGLLGQVRRVWASRGYKPIARIQLVYKWGYLALAVDGRAGKLYWTWQANMKKESCAQTVEQYRQAGVSAMVWDGAKGHWAKLTRAVGVKQIIQPAYSPELNPAERVFEEVRRAVEGRVYEDLEAKKAAIDAYLRELAGDAERIRRLAGWGWIMESCASLPEFSPSP